MFGKFDTPIAPTSPESCLSPASIWDTMLCKPEPNAWGLRTGNSSGVAYYTQRSLGIERLHKLCPSFGKLRRMSARRRKKAMKKVVATAVALYGSCATSERIVNNGDDFDTRSASHQRTRFLPGGYDL